MVSSIFLSGTPSSFRDTGFKNLVSYPSTSPWNMHMKLKLGRVPLQKNVRPRMDVKWPILAFRPPKNDPILASFKSDEISFLASTWVQFRKILSFPQKKLKKVDPNTIFFSISKLIVQRFLWSFFCVERALNSETLGSKFWFYILDKFWHVHEI